VGRPKIEHPRMWHEIEPKDAVDIRLPTEGIQGPRDTEGDECPWPWDPQQLTGVPLGMYHCRYCGEMVMAGYRHPDYGLEIEPEDDE
jgi:hypothetical protein